MYSISLQEHKHSETLKINQDEKIIVRTSGIYFMTWMYTLTPEKQTYS